MDTEKHYELLMKLEIETIKMRHANFTALLSISFVIPALALSDRISNTNAELSKIIFVLGLIFYSFAVFHYKWYHRYSHLYRKRLKEIEGYLDIDIYRNRIRPQKEVIIMGRKYNFKFHFEWILYIIWIIYFFITCNYSGVFDSLSIFLFSVFIYAIFLFYSRNQPVEPNE